METGADFFVGGRVLQNVSLIAIDDTPVIESFADLFGFISQRSGREVALLFAEPRVSRSNGAAHSRVDWYARHEGIVRPLEDLDASSALTVTRVLETRLAALRPLIYDPANGARVSAMLNLLSSGSILSVGGQPVLVDWGMLPAGLIEDEAARVRHFAGILGAHAGDFPAPVASRAEWVRRFSSPQAAHAMAPAAKPEAETGAPRAAAAVPASVPGEPKPHGRCAVLGSLGAGIALALSFIPGVLAFPGDKWITPEHARALEIARSVLERTNQRIAQIDALLLLDCPAFLQRQGQSTALPPRMTAIDPPQPAPGSPAPAGPPQTPQMTGKADRISKGVVLVISGNYTGSGFFIAPDLIVTNQHVVEDRRQAKVASKVVGVVDAQVIATSGDGLDDYALLRVAPQANAAPFKLTTRPELMQNAIAAGFPGLVMGNDDAFASLIRGDASSAARLVPNFTAGIINHLQPHEGAGVTFIVHSADISKGNSGGPLVDMCDRVLGINTFGIPADARDLPVVARYALGSDGIAAFLSSHSVTPPKDDAVCGPPAPAAGGAAPPVQTPRQN
ncbi:S1 family peptidase [Xanthobacter tagetidis]|uniref:S1 family peptidase n=1 Tax=Xanthobacter tagetidis TaxID=60216 RepID=UPI0011C48BA1|nr:serine protease [Xanthobacter tagetidis]MBB6309768.1 hypothetical protein [Xanthobacter tagetidis]